MRRLELDEHEGDHGQHGEWHFQDDEERQRGEGDGGGEWLAHHGRVQREADQRHDVGDQTHHALHASAHDPRHLLRVLQLHLAQVVDLALERLLPAVVLDHADARQHLVHQLHARVRLLQHLHAHGLCAAHEDELPDQHEDVDADRHPGDLAHLLNHQNDTHDQLGVKERKRKNHDGNHGDDVDRHHELQKYVRIGGHDVHKLARRDVAFGGGGQTQRLAVDGLGGHALEGDSEFGHHHEKHRIHDGDD